MYTDQANTRYERNWTCKCKTSNFARQAVHGMKGRRRGGGCLPPPLTYHLIMYDLYCPLQEIAMNTDNTEHSSSGIRLWIDDISVHMQVITHLQIEMIPD